MMPSRRECLLGLVSGALSAMTLPAHARVGATAALPALRRGLNLTHWFEYEQGQPVSLGELKQLRAVGLDHIRLPVDPVVGGWRPERGAKLQNASAVRGAVEQALAAGLEVVVDLHFVPETKVLIERNPVAERSLLALWAQLARGLADLPSQQVAFELFNEPQYYGWRAWRWPGLQEQLLQTLREHAPRHLALLSGNEGGSLKGLTRLPLVRDPAVAYVFHYYEPFLFTHQGAEWLDARYTTAGLRRGVRYPARDAAASEPPLAKPHVRAAEEWAQYLKEDWGPQRIRRDIDVAGKFARKHGVRLVCNEFGTIRANVDPASRYRWMNDVRIALEAQPLGWTLWDYTDIFGITAESGQPGHAGNRHLEPQALAALGLNAEALVR